METGLKNRVAIVAASSQGLGMATAEAFAAEGCKVAICERNAKTLSAVAEKIKSQYSVDVYAEAVDVTDSTTVHQCDRSQQERRRKIYLKAGLRTLPSSVSASRARWRTLSPGWLPSALRLSPGKLF
jgi:NADP-dependent 3-hydroxy acid dehydrogenase YdfG